MANQQKLTTLNELLDTLSTEIEMPEEQILIYKNFLQTLGDEKIDGFYDKFIVRKEKAMYDSPAIYLYRYLDHM